MPEPGELLAREARSLVERLRLWTPQRWAAAAPPFGTRGDLVHHLAASFAAEETGRPLPRLDRDVVLPDQLAVTADDLVRSGRAELGHVAHLLAHRRDLLGEDVPAGLMAQLGNVPVRCPDQEAC
ncbi:MAG: hypothetical protein NVSMB55_18880 [Mycobacteriales bacterium]